MTSEERAVRVVEFAGIAYVLKQDQKKELRAGIVAAIDQAVAEVQLKSDMHTLIEAAKEINILDYENQKTCIQRGYGSPSYFGYFPILAILCRHLGIPKDVPNGWQKDLQKLMEETRVKYEERVLLDKIVYDPIYLGG